MKHTFKRLHIPSGSISVDEFNISHDTAFHYPDDFSYNALQALKLRILNNWNRQQPTEWKYWLD